MKEATRPEHIEPAVLQAVHRTTEAVAHRATEAVVHRATEAVVHRAIEAAARQATEAAARRLQADHQASAAADQAEAADRTAEDKQV